MKNDKMTIRQMIMWATFGNLYPITCVKMQEQISLFLHKKVRLSSLSSQLCKMVKCGEIELHENFGPRGGNGYTRSSGCKVTK